MKIVFLCGSLEPGRDGVGDYVRQLALELQRKGQQPAAIALNDKYTTEVIELILPLTEEAFPILRIPTNWTTYRRFQRAYQWVEEFQPNWISLQFVPYSFHPKGLPITLGKNILWLTHNRQVHLMMHECWVGTEPGTTLKRRVASYMQKKIVNRLIARLQPSVIHTHLPIYRTRLQHLGWQVLPLPLFSNIPVAASLPVETNHKVFRIGIFSQADINSSFIDFLEAFIIQLDQYCKGCQVQILLIGGESAKMSALKPILETIHSLYGQVYYTGFLEPTQLSNALLSCQLGITIVPRNGLGKSSAAAAFLAHGIPIAAPYIHSESIATEIGFFSDDLRSAILTYPDIPSYMAAKIAAQKAKSIIQLSAITKAFLMDLSKVQ